MYAEICSGLHDDPAEHLTVTFEAEPRRDGDGARHPAVLALRAPPHPVPRQGPRGVHPRQGRSDHRALEDRPARRRLQPPPAGAGDAHRADRRRDGGHARAAGRDGGDRGRAPVHVDARHPEVRLHHGDLGRAGPVPPEHRHPRRGHALHHRSRAEPCARLSARAGSRSSSSLGAASARAGGGETTRRSDVASTPAPRHDQRRRPTDHRTGRSIKSEPVLRAIRSLERLGAGSPTTASARPSWSLEQNEPDARLIDDAAATAPQGAPADVELAVRRLPGRSQWRAAAGGNIVCCLAAIRRPARAAARVSDRDALTMRPRRSSPTAAARSAARDQRALEHALRSHRQPPNWPGIGVA